MGHIRAEPLNEMYLGNKSGPGEDFSGSNSPAT